MVKRIPLKKIIGTEIIVDYSQAIQKFNCQDKDVEKFLKEKALEFDKRNKSRTYLLIDGDNKDEFIIWGYYTLTMKNLPFENNVSRSAIKKIDGFRNDISSTEKKW